MSGEAAEERIGAKMIDCERRMDEGLCYHFSNSILAMTVDEVYRQLTYPPIEQTQGSLYLARYGAMYLGLATSEETAHHYQEIHKEMAADFEADKLVEEVRGLKKDRKAITDRLQEELTKLILAGFIPGTCELCR